MPKTDKPRHRSTKAQAQAKAAEAFTLWITGLSYGAVSDRLGYGNMGNAYRAVQRHIDNLPDPGPTDRRRSIEHQRLDAIWKLAYAKADQGDVPAMRVLVEISRRRALLDGLDRPEVWQIESGPRDLRQQHVPTLRDVLPPELAEDTQAVREQALLLHRALPMPPATGQVDTRT